jgi:diguanylate cyclase (GGDEF)-like protein
MFGDVRQHGAARRQTRSTPRRADEGLVEKARERRPTRPAARDLATSASLGGGFLAAAIAAAITLPWHRGANPLVVAALVTAFAILSRIELEAGPGSVVPTEIVFVPMLLALPLPLVPFCVAAGYALGAVPDYRHGRAHPARFLVLLGNSWFALGPTIVLAAFATDAPSWRNAPWYLLALAAQFALDFLSSATRERIAFGHPVRALLPSFGWVYAVDSLLAPVGLGAALAGGGAFLVFVPLACLLALIARDRRARIDRVLEFDHAYRGALDEAHRDDLTGLANRRKLLADLESVFADGDGDAEHILVMYDLNGFKYYNDNFGHPAGDILLRRLGENLAAVAEPATSYRLGGDEFCVLANLPADEVESLLAATTGALSLDGDGFSVTTCFGAVFLFSEAADPAGALRIADRRLYAQKHARTGGRGQPHEVLLQAMLERDPELRAHLQGVADLTAAVGRRVGVSENEIEELVIAAELHDLGKLAIPDAVLNKPGPLDKDEWALIQQHTVIGERILAAAPGLNGVSRIVRASHERWDGTGYVDGLAGEEIPLAARIIAVCDTFAAMTSDRLYRKAMRIEEAFAELKRCAGTQFDPRVVDAFCDEFERRGLVSPSALDAA